MFKQLDIGPIVITPDTEQDYSIDGFGGGYGPPPVPGWTASVHGEIIRRTDKLLFEGSQAAKNEYEASANSTFQKVWRSFPQLPLRRPSRIQHPVENWHYK